MNRREFVRLLPAAAVAAQPAPSPKSRVVLARDPSLRIDPSARLARLLDRAVQAFFDRDNPLEAWKLVAHPGQVVGLKVNCLAGRGTASTNPVLVEAISERLRQAGIPAKDILVFDRLNADLEAAGFRIADHPARTRTLGNDALGYEGELASFGSVASLLSRALTRHCDTVINLPVLKDHGIAGVTIALKNLFGAIHNPNKYHLTVGNPYVADLWMLPPVREKVRLTICDAVTPQYEGGPSFMPQWSWPMNTLLIARDPVALDETGCRILERKRAEKGLPSLAALKRRPDYIATAADADHRIGTNDPTRIERLEV